ncbi:hypothetical protein CBOM_00808 [Ceraceosorus bombacis]|uniref:Uncharacterized protein n=1 Tax=Ceraceosorus bombacis TaxID=401625 RepID=A0A0P1BA31_9BASI|nr:hypothetical protein CBOM_00808 [Ceraceosorus bombacis]
MARPPRTWDAILAVDSRREWKADPADVICSSQPTGTEEQPDLGRKRSLERFPCPLPALTGQLQTFASRVRNWPALRASSVRSFILVPNALTAPVDSGTVALIFAAAFDKMNPLFAPITTAPVSAEHEDQHKLVDQGKGSGQPTYCVVARTQMVNMERKGGGYPSCVIA